MEQDTNDGAELKQKLARGDKLEVTQMQKIDVLPKMVISSARRAWQLLHEAADVGRGVWGAVPPMVWGWGWGWRAGFLVLSWGLRPSLVTHIIAGVARIVLPEFPRFVLNQLALAANCL